METVYLALFLIGLIYAIMSVFIGDIFDFHFDIGGGSLPFISPMTIASFITVFGGCGYMMSANTNWNGLVIAAVSIACALFFASLMFLFIMLPLYKAEKSAAHSAKEMIGQTAEVVTLIMDGSKGEIIYEQGGVRLSAPARIVEGQLVRQGELVRISDVVSGTFIVEKLGAGKEQKEWI